MSYFQEVLKNQFTTKIGGKTSYLNEWEIGLNRTEKCAELLPEETNITLKPLDKPTSETLYNQKIFLVKHLTPNDPGFKKTTQGKIVIPETLQKNIEINEPVLINSNVERLPKNWPFKLWKEKNLFKMDLDKKDPGSRKSN